MKILNNIRTISLVSAVSLIPLLAAPLKAQTNELKVDSFQYIHPGGITDKTVLSKAPDPSVCVNGEKSNAIIVVNIKQHKLYKYNKQAQAEIAYPVATGLYKNSTPTGIYSIGWIEYSPYKSAPPGTKRHRKPYLFGDKAIIMYRVDPKTGKKSSTNILIHGHKKGAESSIGTNASLGCIRLFNPDISKLAEDVKSENGAFVKFIYE